MIKKTASVIALLLVIITVFCACGKAKDNEETDYNRIATDALAEYKPEASGNKNPVAALVLKDKSVVLIELFPDIAPNTVKNFIKLANSGFYDGLIFHRIIDGFMVQGGDPLGTGRGDPGYAIPGEFTNNNFKNELKHQTGVISMARAGSRVNPELYYNTAGSQFFICVADCSSLNGDYASFGKVVSGMDKILSMAKVTTDSNDKPVEAQYMESIRVETFGVTYAEPETLAK